MSTKEEARSLASETITDLTKQLILVDDRIESLYNEVSRIHAIYRTVQYATVEKVIPDSEIDDALSAVENMLTVLLDNISETSGMSRSFIGEVL
ncbi:MAG: hypothetical protein ACLRPH_00895 [Ruminococcus sp.]